MRRFWHYATGIIWRPHVVIPELVNESNKKLITFYAILWNNLLLLGFVGVITIHRLATWSQVNIKTFPEILPEMLVFLFVSNSLLLTAGFAHKKYMLKHFNSPDLRPSIHYSTLYLSVFLLLLIIFGFVYHFLSPLLPSDRIFHAPLLKLCLATVCGVVYLFWIGFARRRMNWNNTSRNYLDYLEGYWFIVLGFYVVVFASLFLYSVLSI